MGDRLRPLWDFNDLDASRTASAPRSMRRPTDVGRAEVLTQLARVEGLRRPFRRGRPAARRGGAAGRLGSARPRPRRARTRTAAPLGRRLRGGDAAVRGRSRLALAIPHEFIAVDAAHMVAIAAPTFDDRLAWADRGIEMAQSSDDPEVTTWLGSLYNNVGWDHFDAGEYETALDWFERALAEREQRPDEPARIAHARGSRRGGPAHARGAAGLAWTPKQRSHSCGASSRSSRRPALLVSPRWPR